MLRERADTDAYGNCNLAAAWANRVTDRLGPYAASQAFGDSQGFCRVQAMQDDCELFASHARQQVTVPAVLP